HYAFGVRCQKTSPWCTLGTGNSPPNGGDRVGVAIACSELLDGAEEPEMGSEGGRLCADTWPAPPRERLSARLSEPSREQSPSGSGARGEALDESSRPNTRASSRRESGAESDSSASAVSGSSKRVIRGAFKRPRVEDGQGHSSSSNTQGPPDPPKIPTTARGRGRGKRKRLAHTAQSEPAEQLAAESGALQSGALSDSSVMEVIEVAGLEGEAESSVALRQTIREELRRVAGKKCQSAQLKSVEASIMAAIFEVCSVPSAAKVHQELAEMRRELVRLSASNAHLESELRCAKADLAVCRGRQPQASTETELLGLVRREMAVFQQRFDVLESRFLRPPLAASSSYAAVAAGSSTSSGQSGHGAQPRAKTRAAPAARAPAPPPVQAPVAQMANGTVEQVNKKKRRGTAAQQTAPATSELIPPTRDLSG
ncbi:hypothetical protein SFRURICE_010031, partial [Spodoptera frugiperda]